MCSPPYGPTRVTSLEDGHELGMAGGGSSDDLDLGLHKLTHQLTQVARGNWQLASGEEQAAGGRWPDKSQVASGEGQMAIWGSAANVVKTWDAPFRRQVCRYEA